MITCDELKSLYEYIPKTGIFIRKTEGKRWKSGSIAGYTHKHNGYVYININNKMYLSHRLAWLYTFGEFPKFDIDHIDGILTNNSISNLRAVTEIVNCQNQKRAHIGSKSGILGVYPKGKKWMSTICVNKIPKYLGTFATKDEAYSAYISAKRKFHQGCTI